MKKKKGASGEMSPDVRCQECNTPIPPDATTCGHCHAPIVRRYCPGCSKLVPETTELCPFCGTSSHAPVKNRSLFTSNMLAVTSVVFFFLLVAASLTRSPNPPQSTTLASRVTASRVPLKPRPPSNSTRVNPAGGMAQSLPAGVPNEVEAIRLNFEAHDLMTQGNYDAAIPLLKQSVAQFPQGADAIKYALYNLGFSLRRTGHSQDAIAYLEQCVKLDAQWELAANELARARSQTQVVTQ